MSNELATTTPALLAPTTGTIQLQEWAAELSAAHALGTALCQTDFVPKDFKGKPEAAAAAILAGKSLGLDPMNSLANIFVVHGRPALYARTMAALVMREGHELVRSAATPTSVTVRARRKGSTEWQDFTWTMERAATARYTSNEKYKTNPVEMLYAKALTEACRVIAPDVLTGVATYSVEEIELEDMGETSAPAPRGKGTSSSVRQAMAQAPSDAAPEPAPVAAPPEPEADPEPAATTAQITKVNILLQELGQTERAEKLMFLSDWTGRTITSSKDLTKDEAHRFIEECENPAVDADGVVVEVTA
jgi:hypothetical protein